MDSSQFFGISMLAYLIASAFYIGRFLFQVRKAALVGLILTILAVLVETAAMGLRWHESNLIGFGHAPLTNMYESLVFFAWATALLFLFLEFRFKTQVLGAFVLPSIALTMAYATIFTQSDIAPLVPALQSDWLIAHVVTCFIGYGAFVVCGGIGVMYLLKDSPAGRNAERSSLLYALPGARILDDLVHKTMVFGFLWLSAGIVTGSIWASAAWGTYWSWDPKETWSLITWFFYAFTLHTRFTRGWRGKRIAWLAICGILVVFFCYFGVNYWLSGLHSYGAS